MYWILISIVVAIFIFIILISWHATNQKYDGTIVIKDEEGKRIFSLEIDIDPDEIEKMNVVVFKVVKEKIAD